MKKNLMAICLLLCSVAALAGSPFKKITGKENLKPILRNEAEALIEIDWSNAKFDKTKDLKTQFAGDYDYILNDCEQKFIEGFNEKTKKMKLVKNSSDAKYKVVLNVSSVDHYYQAMIFIPRFEAKMWGNLEIIDLTTNQPVVTVVIDEAEEGYDFVIKDCYGKTFKELGGNVAKLK